MKNNWTTERFYQETETIGLVLFLALHWMNSIMVILLGGNYVQTFY